MEKRTREKIALVIFALLVVLGGVLLTSYFTTGRSWNVAASFLDDSVGSLDGYTAVVYAGVVEPEEDDEEETPDFSEGTPLASDEEGDGAGASVGAGESGASGAEDVGAGAVGGDAESPASDEAADSAGGEADGAASEEAEGLDDAGAAGSTGSEPEDSPNVLVQPPRDINLGIFSFLANPSLGKSNRYVSDVRLAYEEKGASALTIDISDLSLFAEPQIRIVDGKRIGIFSIEAYTTSTLLARYLTFFEEHDADVVMCLTPRAKYLEDCEGVDVVVVTTDYAYEDVTTRGETRGHTLVVRSPEVGEVCAVLLTTNNVPSARVVTGS